MANPQQGESYGILPPKQPMVAKVTTGTQRAARLAVVLCVLVVAVIVFLGVRDRYQKPIKLYYKALEAQNADKMCMAFPAWLVDADVSEDSMTIHTMCASMISTVRANFGDGCNVDMDYAGKTAIEESYLAKLEEGICKQYQVEVDISEGWQVKLDVVYSYVNPMNGAGGENAISMTEYARVYKIDGKWYLLDVPGSQS
ncbi:MAG: hypothetical protein ACI4J3_02250 [Oscillospiraceae bacterium]